MLALGQPAWIPYALVGVNLFSLCLMAYWGGRYAGRLGRSGLWGAALPLYAGFIFSFSGNLTEIVECTLLVGSFLAVHRRRVGVAALLLSLAVMTRETALLAVGSIALTYSWRDRQATARRQTIVLCLPIVIYLLWQFVLVAIWGHGFGVGGLANFGVPLVGLARFIAALISQKPYFVQLLWLIELVVMAAFTLAVWRLWQASRASREIKLAYWLYLGPILFFTNLIWVNDWAFMRVMAEYYVLGGLILMASPRRLSSGWLAAQMALGVMISLYTVFTPL